MKNNKWYVAAAMVVLLALSAPASAHDMNKHGEGAWGGHHHHMMCKSADMKKDKALFREMHVLHEKLHAVLVAKTFDKKEFLSLSDQMGQLRSRMMRQHAEAFADRAVKLSQEEREKMMGGFHHNHAHENIMWQGRNKRSDNNATNDWVPPSDR